MTGVAYFDLCCDVAGCSAVYAAEAHQKADISAQRRSAERHGWRWVGHLDVCPYHEPPFRFGPAPTPEGTQP